MKCLFHLTAVILFSATALVRGGSAPAPGKPSLFEKKRPFAQGTAIDRIVLKTLREKRIAPARLSSDAVFLRRVYLDVLGTLPQAGDVTRFLRDPHPRKRARIINRLLDDERFADYWTLKWCDILRIKSEFPINLWPNGVQAYAGWIHQALEDNMPYDQFARALLTSSGSNFRVPPVNFYRAVQEPSPQALAHAVALTFMGVRLESWTKEKQENLEVFFSHLAFKKTAEWKEEIVYVDPSPRGPIAAVLPDGAKVTIAPQEDPRPVFARWLITKENPFFARAIVNRIWCRLMGRGLVHEVDDIRVDNPPVHPELLSLLEKELVTSGWDMKQIFRLVLTSQTYQQSSIPQTPHADAELLFACYPVRQLEAEVLSDVLCLITGTTEQYSSMIPEPYTFIPEFRRSVQLVDGSITSQFLEMFGRPPRDTGLVSERSTKSNESQRLHLLNSTHIQNKLERSWRLRTLLNQNRKTPRRLINTIYLTVLSRLPTDEETQTVLDHAKTKGLGQRNAMQDLVWALINTKEFLYKH